MKTGILGGTFDPIHTGHLEAAEAARRALTLDRVLLLPSRTPPHRSAEPRASVFHRFAMTALAAADRDGLLASDIELQRAGPSYTALTLEAMHREGFAASRLFFILGSDAFADIAAWYDYPRLLELSNFVVVSAPGLSDPRSPIPDPWLPGVPPRCFLSKRKHPTCHRPKSGGVWPPANRLMAWCRVRWPTTSIGIGCTLLRPWRRCCDPARKGTSRRFPAQVQRAIAAAQDRQAADVVVLDLRPADGFTDYFHLLRTELAADQSDLRCDSRSARRARHQAGARRRLRPRRMDSAGLLRLHRAHLQPGRARLLRPRAALGQRQTDRGARPCPTAHTRMKAERR